MGWLMRKVVRKMDNEGDICLKVCVCRILSGERGRGESQSFGSSEFPVTRDIQAQVRSLTTENVLTGFAAREGGKSCSHIPDRTHFPLPPSYDPPNSQALPLQGGVVWGPSTWEEFKASFSYMVSLRLAWATRDLVSEPNNNRDLRDGSEVESVCCFFQRP